MVWLNIAEAAQCSIRETSIKNTLTAIRKSPHRLEAHDECITFAKNLLLIYWREYCYDIELYHALIGSTPRLDADLKFDFENPDSSITIFIEKIARKYTPEAIQVKNDTARKTLHLLDYNPSEQLSEEWVA